MRVEGVDRWIMREGRICDYGAFYDMNEVARQAGHHTGARQPRLQARFSRR